MVEREKLRCGYNGGAAEAIVVTVPMPRRETIGKNTDVAAFFRKVETAMVAQYAILPLFCRANPVLPAVMQNFRDHRHVDRTTAIRFLEGGQRFCAAMHSHCPHPTTGVPVFDFENDPFSVPALCVASFWRLLFSVHLQRALKGCVARAFRRFDH